MATVPPDDPNRIMPQSPPDVRPPQPQRLDPCPPEAEPCPPNIDEPDRSPAETPPCEDRLASDDPSMLATGITDPAW